MALFTTEELIEIAKPMSDYEKDQAIKAMELVLSIFKEAGYKCISNYVAPVRSYFIWRHISSDYSYWTNICGFKLEIEKIDFMGERRTYTERLEFLLIGSYATDTVPDETSAIDIAIILNDYTGDNSPRQNGCLPSNLIKVRNQIISLLYTKPFDDPNWLSSQGINRKINIWCGDHIRVIPYHDIYYPSYDSWRKDDDIWIERLATPFKPEFEDGALTNSKFGNVVYGRTEEWVSRVLNTGVKFSNSGGIKRKNTHIIIRILKAALHKILENNYHPDSEEWDSLNISNRYRNLVTSFVIEKLVLESTHLIPEEEIKPEDYLTVIKPIVDEHWWVIANDHRRYFNGDREWVIKYASDLLKILYREPEYYTIGRRWENW